MKHSGDCMNDTAKRCGGSTRTRERVPQPQRRRGTHHMCKLMTEDGKHLLELTEAAERQYAGRSRAQHLHRRMAGACLRTRADCAAGVRSLRPGSDCTPGLLRRARGGRRKQSKRSTAGASVAREARPLTGVLADRRYLDELPHPPVVPVPTRLRVGNMQHPRASSQQHTAGQTIRAKPHIRTQQRRARRLTSS